MSNQEKWIPQEMTDRGRLAAWWFTFSRALPFHAMHFLAKVKIWTEGFDLFEQSIDQFPGVAHRQRGDVVNGFVGIQFRALSTGLGQCVHNVSADVLQTQFENLEQARGASADNHGVGIDLHLISVLKSKLQYMAFSGVFPLTDTIQGSTFPVQGCEFCVLQTAPGKLTAIPLCV